MASGTVHPAAGGRSARASRRRRGGSQPLRPLGESGQEVGTHARNRPVRLVIIGLAAGFFGALFGVGGGIIIVPLLILLAAYPERSAMATSSLRSG